jgi:hypothetical protein
MPNTMRLLAPWTWAIKSSLPWARPMLMSMTLPITDHPLEPRMHTHFFYVVTHAELLGLHQETTTT